jgi:hypothetical protein
LGLVLAVTVTVAQPVALTEGWGLTAVQRWLGAFHHLIVWFALTPQISKETESNELVGDVITSKNDDPAVNPTPGVDG